VIEDEEGVLDLARRVLEDQGHRVLEAQDGPTAIQVLEQFSAELDLVLSDVIVPDIATTELERLVHRRNPDLPLVYMSGYSQQEIVQRGLIPAHRAFLQKPFTGAELNQLVCGELETSVRSRSPRVTT
jgi:two-component system, cell cycle sensor histidine kinase and response regulator CckA